MPCCLCSRWTKSNNSAAREPEFPHSLFDNCLDQGLPAWLDRAGNPFFLAPHQTASWSGTWSPSHGGHQDRGQPSAGPPPAQSNNAASPTAPNALGFYHAFHLVHFLSTSNVAPDAHNIDAGPIVRQEEIIGPQKVKRIHVYRGFSSRPTLMASCSGCIIPS